MTAGRPSLYTPELAKAICIRLANGESLRSICKDDCMPDRTVIYDWLFSNDEFANQYARAREEQAETLADEIIDIADDGANDYMEKLGANGETGALVLNSEHVQRSKLRLEARKWVASKLKPKKYGERMIQEIVGGGKAPMFKVVMASDEPEQEKYQDPHPD